MCQSKTMTIARAIEHNTHTHTHTHTHAYIPSFIHTDEEVESRPMTHARALEYFMAYMKVAYPEVPVEE